VCHFQILAIREFGLFSARRLMGQLSQVCGMISRWSKWYKEFAKEGGRGLKFGEFSRQYESE